MIPSIQEFIKNPNDVAGLTNAELALRALSDKAHDRVASERVTDIRNAALHAAELTNQMLAYSGRGHFDVRPARHQPTHVLCGRARRLQRLIQAEPRAVVA